MTEQPSLARQWGESLADPSGTAFARIAAADVVLEGSAFARPIRGRQAVWATLRAAAGIYDTMAFTSDAERDDHMYLDWVAAGLGLSIAGVTVLHVDHSGRVRTVAVHHRPLGAVVAFSGELRTRLAGQISADHFHCGA